MAAAGIVAEDAVPSKKNQRYDRQLRLWGDHGQDALSSASICCVGASAVATEILKNLVLPGIGAFTLVDPGTVTDADCGNNFFVTEDQIGESRAKCATELLLEMNEYVKGDWIQNDAATLLRTQPDFFNAFTVVIAVNQVESVVAGLADVLFGQNVPLLLARAYGNIGFIQIVVKEHCVIECHAEEKHDMRLTKPFPSLVEYMNALPAVDKMEQTKADTMPFAVLLYQQLRVWEEAHGGASPSSYAERKEFKEQLKASHQQEKGSIKELPLNYSEAIDKCNPSITPDSSLDGLSSLLNRARETPLAADAHPFWILVDALVKFVDLHGELPLRGTIPDMHAASDVYVALQKVYIDKAAEDVGEITNTVTETLQALGRPADMISEAEIRRFCRNANKLFVLETPPFRGEFSPAVIAKFEAALAESNSEISWYLLLRAADRFCEAHGHFPGHFDEQVGEDIPKLKEIALTMLEDFKIGATINDDCVHEMCRFGASELHSVAAFVGGVAGQEVVKLVTKQYPPLNSIFVYNGITAGCAQIML